MNGRVVREPSPEGRLAAVARTLTIRLRERGKEPDYADYRDAFRPFIRRELILARIEEARHDMGQALTARARELAAELIAVEREIEENLKS